MTTAAAPYLVATEDQLRASFRALQSREDVAALLEVSPQLLRWVLFGTKERTKYSELVIPKRHGGFRRICAPPKNLKILQHKLLKILTVVYVPRPCVTGFTRGRSTFDNAQSHVGRSVILNFDLEDFFPSIHIGRVTGTLQGGPFFLPREAALTIAQIATHADGHLPQGAPTSAILANLVCGPLDTSMMLLAGRHRLRYTRYADDITFSTTRRALPREIGTVDDDGTCHLGAELVSEIAKHRFCVRDGKTRLRDRRRRQIVTGLVVNEFANVPRMFVREVRTLIYSSRTKGLDAAAAVYTERTCRTSVGEAASWMQNVIRGKLAYLKMIRGVEDPVFRRLLRDANRIPGAAFWPEVPLAQQEGQPLRRRTRKSVNWALWVERYQSSVFRLRCIDPRGARDSFGTAFRVGTSAFATAGHNARYKRGGDGALIDRELALWLPLDHPIPIARVSALIGEQGAIDMALANATLPEDWDEEFVPTQERLPQVGEEIAALGFPDIAFREPGLVLHVGRVESIGRGYRGGRYITVSFPSGPGLSGSPLLDSNGYCVGVMVENTYLATEAPPGRPYGQAVAIGHWREIPGCGNRITSAL